MKPIKRFSLFTSNCNTLIQSGTRAYEFRFNLNGGYLECDGELRIAIESINVRDSKNIIPAATSYTSEVGTGSTSNAGITRQVALGNTENKITRSAHCLRFLNPPSCKKPHRYCLTGFKASAF